MAPDPIPDPTPEGGEPPERARHAFVPPRWAKPVPIGYGYSADAAHFVAAPLLAAAAMAVVGVVSADSEKFRLPGAALLALSCSAIALLASIQYGFHARAMLYSAADVEAWWGKEDFAERGDQLRSLQQEHFDSWRHRVRHAVDTYNLGITLLGAGMTVALLPPGGSGVDTGLRWASAGIVLVATLAEAVWLVRSPRRSTQTRSWRRR